VQRELRVVGAVPEQLPHPRLHVPQGASPRRRRRRRSAPPCRPPPSCTRPAS
jgi:hypothetical protein